MVKSHWLCEPVFHCGSSTWELGTNGNGGGVPTPATTGGVIDEKRVGKVMVLPSIPTRNAFDGSVPLFPLQSAAVPAVREGPRHNRLCAKPIACRVSMAVCTPFKRS